MTAQAIPTPLDIAKLIPLARRTARKISNTDEAESDAMLALWKGVQRYDPDKGASPTTFLTYCIKGAVLDGMRERDHLSRNDRQKVKAGQEIDRPLSPPISLEALREAISYDAPAPAMIDSEAIEAQRRLTIRVEAVWKLVAMALPSRTATILRMHYVEGMTLKAIGEQFDVTESRMSQVINNALHDLRMMVGE